MREINARLNAHDQSIGIIREYVDAHEESIETIRENVTDRRKTEAMFFAVTSEVSEMVGPSLNLTPKLVTKAVWPSLALETDQTTPG